MPTLRKCSATSLRARSEGRTLVRVEGTLVHIGSAAPIRVAFPYGAEDAVLLDEDGMAEQAPAGVRLDAAPAAELGGAWEVTEAAGLPDEGGAEPDPAGTSASSAPTEEG